MQPTGTLFGLQRNRIWLVDARQSNLLFRGPLPLDAMADDGAIDFPTLIVTMNRRLRQQRAPSGELPTELAFIDVALISNRLVDGSRGDEGFALHRIYSTILGAEQPRPDEDADHPTSLFTGPLDNTVAAGLPISVAADGRRYTIHPRAIWLPVSGNPVPFTPAPRPDGADGYETILAGSFPVVALTPSAAWTSPGLSRPLSNVSVVARMLQEWMARDVTAEMPHVYYVHCTNGHDRVGMAVTGYVLAAYGAAFDFDLEIAYQYGMTGAYLPGQQPDGVPPEANYWRVVERQDPGCGALKKEYLEVLQALACLYHPTGGVPPAPRLAARVPEKPLWEAGYAFADPANTPTVETPAHYVRVRPGEMGRRPTR